MTSTEAHILLNAAKAGKFVRRSAIKAALRATGDVLPGEVPRFVTGDPLPWKGNARPQRCAPQPSYAFSAWPMPEKASV